MQLVTCLPCQYDLIIFSSLIFFHENLVGAVDLVAEVALTTGAAFSLFKNSSKDLGDFPSFPASQPIFLSELSVKNTGSYILSFTDNITCLDVLLRVLFLIIALSSK